MVFDVLVVMSDTNDCCHVGLACLVQVLFCVNTRWHHLVMTWRSRSSTYGFSQGERCSWFQILHEWIDPFDTTLERQAEKWIFISHKKVKYWTYNDTLKSMKQVIDASTIQQWYPMSDPFLRKFNTGRRGNQSLNMSVAVIFQEALFTRGIWRLVLGAVGSYCQQAAWHHQINLSPCWSVYMATKGGLG